MDVSGSETCISLSSTETRASGGRPILGGPRKTLSYGRLAQLVRAPRLQRGCQPFKSAIAHSISL
jgi:hypothetical protein